MRQIRRMLKSEPPVVFGMSHQAATARALRPQPRQAFLNQCCTDSLALAVRQDRDRSQTEPAGRPVRQRDRRERLDRAIASVEQDGLVREIIEMFDATLIESSIKPV